MRLNSVNVGLPRQVLWKGREVITSIFKKPVSGRIAVRRENLDGDRQSDLTVHGGPQKAIYVYPLEHYSYWHETLPEVEFDMPQFGENFTTEGLDEESANIGDKFRIGSALVMVTQPRLPCYKLAIRFNRDDIIKKFLASGRTGFYFSVVEEGAVAADDEITLDYRDRNNVTVGDITRLFLAKKKDRELLEKASQLDALPIDWRDYFMERQN